jgi:hypothetical protein
VRTYGRLRYGVDDHGRGWWAIGLEPHVMIKVKRLFPRANPHRTGALIVADTPEVARDIEWMTERWPLDCDDRALHRLKLRADEHRSIEEQIDAILAGHLPPDEWREPARPPRDYQLAADAIAARTGRLLCLDEVGLGKTFTSLLRLRDPHALPALVVTLTHLPRQWQGELQRSLPWLTSHILRRTTPYDPTKLRGIDKQPDVLITSYSKLPGWAAHLAGQVKTVIYDEVQELRHEGTNRYAAAGQVADHATFRIGLSATPIHNYGDEVYNVVSVLDADVLGTREEFLREWCHSSGNGKHIVNEPKALGTYLRDSGVMIRRTRHDVGRELPDAINVPHVVDLDEGVLADLEAQNEVAMFAERMMSRLATRTDRFRAAGELDWRLRHATGVAKAPYVAEFVKLLLESEERIVLWGWHRDVYDDWLERLKAYNPVLYTGSESAAGKDRSARAFMGGDARVLMMSLRSGAGLDGLQEWAKVGVFGELDWSPATHTQCVGRLRRDGMGDDPVVAYYLVAETGSDPVVMDVLGVKRRQSDPLLDPDAPLLTAAEDTSDRIRRLALDVLRRRGGHG